MCRLMHSEDIKRGGRMQRGYYRQMYLQRETLTGRGWHCFHSETWYHLGVVPYFYLNHAGNQHRPPLFNNAKRRKRRRAKKQKDQNQTLIVFVAYGLWGILRVFKNKTTKHGRNMSQFNGLKIAHGFNIHKISDFYEMLTETKETDNPGMKTLCDWIQDFTKRKIAFVVCVEPFENIEQYRFYVSGSPKIQASGQHVGMN